MYALMAAAALRAAFGMDALSHETQVEHAGRALTVRYHAAPQVETRQIGDLTPNRRNAARCVWTARMAVRREVIGTSGPIEAFGRELADAGAAKGSRAGACGQLRAAIVREAGEQLRGGARLREIAAADRADLMQEMASVAQR